VFPNGIALGDSGLTASKKRLGEVNVGEVNLGEDNLGEINLGKVPWLLRRSAWQRRVEHRSKEMQSLKFALRAGRTACWQSFITEVPCV